MGRTSDARERILDAACTLIHTRGYVGIGVAEICTKADVRKGSFYHYFESKQALTLEVVDLHWQQQRATWIATLSTDDEPLQRLESLVRLQIAAQRTAHDTDGHIDGCLLGNLALELSNQDGDVQKKLQEIFADQIDLVAAVLAEAAEQGAIPESNATVETARGVVAQLEGLVMFAKLSNDPAMLDGLWRNTLGLLRA